jgi:hypothetical protein
MMRKCNVKRKKKEKKIPFAPYPQTPPAGNSRETKSECDKLEPGISGYIHFRQGIPGLCAILQASKAPGFGMAM